MTSSSSLYGSVTTQNSSSSNSTSLYGEAGTPIPDSSGNVIVRGDLYVLSGNILTTATTGNIFPANATTINLGNAATTVNIGASSGSTTINNTLYAPGADFGNITIGVATDNTITTTSGQLILKSATGEIDTDTTSILSTNSSSFFLLNSPTTVDAFEGATTLTMGATTGTTTIRNNLVADSGDFGNITIGVVDGNTIATTSGDINLVPTGNNGVNITSGSDFPTLITRNVAVTNQSVRGLTLSALTSLTPAAGFGTSLEYQVEAQAGNSERAGFISVNATDVTTGSEDFSMYFGLMENGATYASKMILDSTGSLALDNDLTIGGTSVNLAQATTFAYDENNDRSNRPEVQSTTGNSSGFRVIAPNSGTSAASTISVGNSSDASNVEFLALQARGSGFSDTFRFVTGEYIADVLNATNKSISFTDYNNTYATINPAGPTIGTDLTTKTYVDNAVSTTGVTSITGTADQVIASSPTGAVTLSLPQSIATTSNPVFAGATLGAITVGVADDNTITTTSGDLYLTATGSNHVEIDSGASLPTIITRTTTSTNVNTRSLTLNAQSTGTPTVGFGNALEFQVETAPGNTEAAGAISVTSTDLTPGSEDFKMNFYLQQAGAANAVKASLSSAGDLVLDGDLTVNDAVVFNGATSGNVTIAAPAIAGSQSYTLPTALPAVTGYVLSGTTGGALSWVPNPDTTYDFAASSTTGGANLNLTGSDATTDTVKLTNGGHVTATYTSATEVTLGSDATDANTANAIVSRDASGNFSASGATLGAVTVGVDSDQTISTTSGNLVLQTAAGASAGTVTLTAGANGDIIVAPNGTGNVTTTFSNGGNISNNRNYVFGAIRNATTDTTNGDIWELNTSGAQGAANPYFRGVSLDNSGDTTRGPATLLRSYSGGAVSGSAQRGRLIFEKARGTAASPTAVQANDILGSIDVTGYTSTGWLNDTIPAVTGFFGFNAPENWVSNTNLGTAFSLSLAPTATTISTGANLVQTLNISPQTFASRSDAFTWANGKTGTTQTMSLDVSGNLIVTGDVRVNGNDIQCSSGASTITMTSANTATTVRGDQINLQTAASVGVTGNKISYNRVYGQWQYDASITPAAANTGYAVPFQGVNAAIDFANIATASNTSEIRPNALGMYKLQFSAQVQNSDNGADHQVTFWWRKNGVDISNSAGYFTVPKAAAATGSLIVGWDNMVEVTTITDYYQLIYAVSDVAVTLPYIAASAPRPGAASVFLTLVPIGA